MRGRPRHGERLGAAAGRGVAARSERRRGALRFCRFLCRFRFCRRRRGGGRLAAALGATAYSGVLGAKIATADGEYVEGATEPAPSTPDEVTAAQRQLQYVQWALPALTGAIVVLGAQQGEQQRPAQILTGLGSTLARRVRK